jgi:hypothetical protein
MKRWLAIAAVIVFSSIVIAADESPRPAPDAPRPDRPMAAERIGNALRQQAERLERLEQQQARPMEMKGRPLRTPDARPFMGKARPMPKDVRHVYPRHRFLCGMMLVCAVVHILAAIWVFQDIRARGAGSGLWIVIALLAGLLGVLVYAVIRLGDAKKT